jgi:hypothetical protein
MHPVKIASLCLLLCLGNAKGASSSDNISIAIQHAQGGFVIQASYMSPLTQCQAYALLTDFSTDEPAPGIKSSRVTRLSENIVRVEQVVEDRFLFYTTQFESIIDYTEFPITGMDLHQIKGYFKTYQGSWRLVAKEGGTLFTYQGFILPDSVIPMFVIEHFMNHRMQQRFEKMALRAKSKKDIIPERCK